MKDVATEIVKRIIDDLTDRRGLGDAWEFIDQDVQKEIKAQWRDLVREALASQQE